MIDKLRVLEQNSIQRGIPILGSEKGAWLLSIVQKHKPQRILELGTANGYSGIILGSGGARIVTVDINIVLATEANYNFAQFRIDAEIRLEDGVEYVQHVVKEKKEQFDLIFIDYSKTMVFSLLIILRWKDVKTLEKRCCITRNYKQRLSILKMG